MKPIIAGLVALLTLAACANREEIARREAGEDHARCVNYGFQPPSEGYSSCRMTLDENRRQAEKAAGAALGRAVFMRRMGY